MIQFIPEIQYGTADYKLITRLELRLSRYYFYVIEVFDERRKHD